MCECRRQNKHSICKFRWRHSITQIGEIRKSGEMHQFERPARLGNDEMIIGGETVWTRWKRADKSDNLPCLSQGFPLNELYQIFSRIDWDENIWVLSVLSGISFTVYRGWKFLEIGLLGGHNWQSSVSINIEISGGSNVLGPVKQSKRPF